MENLRVSHQKRNGALDDQPGSIQGDRVPASKLGQCREDSATPAQQLCKRCAVEWKASVMCHAYKGPSSYGVHTEGEGVRLWWTHVDWGRGSSPMWTSTQKIKIRVH